MARPVKNTLLCPHCWQEISVADLLFISESPELFGDVKLGSNAQARFLPVRFDQYGNALDTKNTPCRKTACPNCHLPIPRVLLKEPEFVLSIAGAPASGKSFYLTALTWQLRRTLTKDFMLNFTDADTEMNRRIISYESTLFMADSSNELVSIEKTDITGNIYNTSLINGNSVQFAQPFIFEIAPTKEHPLPNKRNSQAVFIYDNAGEHFLPGADSLLQPVTRHLVNSDAVLFLFDPTQDARFQQAVVRKSDNLRRDKSIANSATIPPENNVRKSPVRQETVLTELINRFRLLNRTEKFKKPFVIVLTKYDAWKQLLEFPKMVNPWKQASNVPISAYNFERVEEYSKILRKLLLDLIPDFVSMSESFADNVSYIAVSATGQAPIKDEKTGMFGYRSGDIRPFWVEVPFFHAQVLAGKETILAGKKNK
ncbi:MAG: hypothetical protein LBU65_12815 [Planctomycetaceae bacterium]|jgi:hypothetical protein|nr:hypothetical protein [Planctomycetaceae bacterium]